VLSLEAQNKSWEGGLLIGGALMGGDLVDANIGSINNLNLAYGLMARRYVNANVAFRFNLVHTRLSANDDLYNRLRDRGFRTESPLTELSLDFEYDLLGHRPTPVVGKLSPYVFAGLGVAFTKPETLYGRLNNDAVLDQSADISKTRFVLPVGAGIRLNIKPTLAMALEFAPRATFSDYLDGVSHSGNPDKNDWYGITSVQLFYKLTNSDRDGDGIADAVDSCPEIAGTALAMGCPDRDNDSVADNKDSCPDIPGNPALDGCPDSDNDGVTDGEDACPTQAGTATMNGCPDTDGDGLSDAADACPNEFGPTANNGCPYGDRDNDGIADDTDGCPDKAGPAANNGCPYTDTDGDGIIDSDDKCPNDVGPLANGGCPVTELMQEDQDVLDFATRNVRFATNSDELLPASYAIMDEVARVMLEHPDFQLKIDGYTDDKGADRYNQQLSELRAKRCYEYLAGKGISHSRMQYAGFGKANPIASNTTDGGRFQNRRVEFTMYK
jgi:outer membrane protein OmpA-like peptidoglycan-associated protein